MVSTSVKPISSAPLSAAEMQRISLEINQDFAPVPCPDKLAPSYPDILSSQELLGISQIISTGFAPSIKNTSPEIVLMPIDPEHVHAYWHLPEPEPLSESNSELTLSLHPLADTHPDDPKYAWLDFFINNRQDQKTLTLPNNTNHQHYFASLSQTDARQQLHTLATSNIAQVPQQEIHDVEPVMNTAQLFQPVAKRCAAHRPSSLILNTSGQNFKH